MKSTLSKLTAVSLAASLLFVISGCTKSDQDAAPVVADNPALAAPVPEGMVRGEVLETMDAGGYTYVLLDTGEEQRWIAGPQAIVKTGDTVQAQQGMAMSQFASKSLGRTFDVLYFVDVLGNLTAPMVPEGHPAISQDTELAAVNLSVAALESGKDIAWLYANRDAVAGQQISLRGEVVKYNEGILGQNFIHIQDGSGDAASGTNDITVTTQGTTAVGETIVVTGTIVLDKDFGAGYTFPVLMADASISSE